MNQGDATSKGKGANIFQQELTREEEKEMKNYVDRKMAEQQALKIRKQVIK